MSLDENTRPNSFAQVAADDAAFRTLAAKHVLRPLNEAKALSDIFSSTGDCSTCEATLGALRWATVRTKWGALRTLPPEKLGAAIATVVHDLDAQHLRPTGISKRLNNGVDAACFGLRALVQNLSEQ
jgi:hypothetical protein